MNFDNGQHLAFHRAVETDGERTTQHDPVDRYREVQDQGLMAQALRLTPAMWRAMPPVRRRLLLDFTVRRIEELDRRAAFMSRNIAAEAETPECWRAGAAI